MKEHGTQILIVEDEPLIGWSVANTLKKAGFNVTTVDSGEQAIEKLNSIPFDLVITDLKLPHIDGFEVALNVKKLSPEVPVLMITATDENIINGSSFKMHIDGVIAKPFDLRKIADMVCEYTHHKATFS
jgi:DNA-binding response OmpR family regulator